MDLIVETCVNVVSDRTVDGKRNGVKLVPKAEKKRSRRRGCEVSFNCLRRTNELEEMRQRPEARKMFVEKTSVACKLTEQDVKTKEDSLSAEMRSLLVGGTTLSIAKSKLQV
ncbi:hypothetical protein HID58_062199 [Brassica napus]|uniref:Uncharacterized protein n=3 Tax=Brassica TaxID=3705 RepID=A0ABQ8A1I3_BRANA|nr:hypothetical protein HID58_062199 [Brassica napus]CDY20326.1 BnaC04g36300D [Brassica napus]